MISVSCKCGATYRVPDKLAGKRAKCKHCGSPIPIPGHSESAPPAADERERPSWIPPLVDETGQQPAEPYVPRGAYSRYFADCAKGFTFISDAGNLITFLIVAVIASTQPLLSHGGFFGMLGLIVVNGWLAAFYFNIVLDVANGEMKLPEISATDGVVDDIIVPLIKFVATWLMVALPAIAYLVVKRQVLGTVLTASDPVFWGLVGLAAFLWPMSVLVIALGGVSSFIRMDRIALTILRTFVPYMMTFLLTAAALGVLAYVQQGALLGGAQPSIALAMLFEVLQLYVWIVTMWAIGSYYRHFKSRFAWSWE